MLRLRFIGLSATLVAATLSTTAQAQTAAPPPFATTKVEGTDNVYIFRYGGHQSMFIVTKDGVIATDPISERRPAAKTYIEEIQKITKAPIKYVIYSHSHYDHIAGGKPFKDLGATFIAHKNAKARIVALKPDDVVVPDQVVDDKKVIKLGGTTLELHLRRQEPLRQHAGDAIAEGEDHLHGRLDPAPRRPIPRHGGHLSARHRGRTEEGDRDGLGKIDRRPSGPGRPANRHQGRCPRTSSLTCRISQPR